MASQGAKSEDYSLIEIGSPDSRLATSITRMIDALPPIFPDHCIYKAPQCVRQSNEKAYTHLKDSIGPLHHGKKDDFLPMEEQKLRYMNAFLNRTKLNLQDGLTFVRGLEHDVRNCYVERVYCSSDEFVQMILVDSSFVIEVIIRRTIFRKEEDKTDYLSKSISLAAQRDMILLENQIPYFVTAGLFNLAFPELPECSFVELSIHYFRCVSLLNHIPQPILQSEVKHFIDLLRSCHLPSTLRSLPPSRVKFVTIPTARDLQQVGLSIRMGLSNNKLDIQYAEGVLIIPKFGVNDESKVILRNVSPLSAKIIVFHICLPHVPRNFAICIDLLT